MAYVNVYPTRINWENDPSINTPINEVNLNKMDYALYQHDQTLANWDTTKANQSDLLLCVKTIAYDTDTGVFVFTWQNGTTQTVDLNIEKIPVSFSMDANGVITMTTEDGTQYTADVGALIKTYTFTDSSVIDFTVTTDQSGNKTITADIVDGSITGTKLQPNYLADCTAAKTAAENAEDSAEDSAEDAEAWAVGQRNGLDVPNTDPTYHNNSKYWASQANVTSLSALTDTDINAPTNNQVLGYDSTSQKWENMDAPSAGLLPYLYITTEADAMVTVKCSGIPDIYPTEVSTGHYECELPAYGLYTIHSDIEGDDATYSFNVDAVKEYNITVMHYIHTINVTVMSGASISVSGGGETLSGVGTGSAQAFVVHHASTTYTVTTTVDGVSAPSQTVNTPATSEQSTSLTFQYGTINLTYANEFRGLSLSCSSGGTTITKTAPATGNSMAFYPPSTGTWEITGVYSGVTYSTGSITVSSLSTAVSALLQTIPDGSTVTPINDVQKLLNCAGIFDKNYTTIGELLADSTSLLTVISDNNAVNYLVRSTGFASSVCANSTAMTDIGANNYCANTLLADSTWCSAICNSTYFESVLNVKVPTMTSNTTPSGECFGSSIYSGSDYYKAFDGNTNDGCLTNSASNQYIGYGFASATTVYMARFTNLVNSAGETTSRIKNFKIQGSNNKTSDYVDLISGVYPNNVNYVQTVNWSTASNYKYYRLFVVDPWESSWYIGAKDIQFYGR